MRLIYHPERKRFEGLAVLSEYHLLKGADFKWDPEANVWYTKEKALAAILAHHAAPDVRERFAGVTPLDLTPRLRYSPERKRFEWYSGRVQKHLAQEASFRLDPALKCWYTTDPDQATRLLGWADADCVQAVQAAQAAQAARQAASRAKTADLAVPKPDNGLDFFPFQKAGIQFGAEVWASGKRGVLIADEMGLGKTLQAIGLVNLHPETRRVLVVCPASLKLNWGNEAGRWLANPDLRIIIAGTKRPKKTEWTYALPGEGIALQSDLFLIINYDILKAWETELKALPWDVLVVDEAHYLKDPEAQRTRHVFGFKKNSRQKAWTSPPLPARHAALLTGTPIVNRPSELHTLVHYCDPGGWPSRYAFVDRYCGFIDTGYGRQEGPGQNLGELQAKLRRSIMARRMKDEVLEELPAKLRQVLELPAPASLEKQLSLEWQTLQKHQTLLLALQEAAQRAEASRDPHRFKLAVDQLQHAKDVAFQDISRVRKETAVQKLPLVIEHVREALTSGKKLIVFGYHTEVIEGLRDAFAPQAALNYGGIPTGEKRQAEVDRFQKDPACRLFIGSVVTAEGYTLTAASDVIFAELDWRPGKVSQSEDRAHRYGQKNSVLVQHLVLEGSLDAKIAKAIVAKQRVIEEAMDDPEAELEQFTGQVDAIDPFALHW